MFHSILKHYSKYPSVFSSLFSFALLFPNAFFGFDITDTGYHLTNQLSANVLGLHYIKISPWWWFSDIVGGWWLKVSDNYGLIGARAGAIFAIAIIAAITAKIMAMHFKNSPLILPVVIVASFFMTIPNVPRILDYYLVPTLLAYISTYFLLQAYRNPDKIWFSVFSGVFCFLLIISRITTLTFLGLPIVIGTLVFFYKRTELSKHIKSLSLFYLSFLVITLIFAFTLYKVGLLHSYIYAKPSFEEDSYTISKLVMLYAKELISYLPQVFSLITLMYVIKSLMDSTNKSKVPMHYLILSTICLLLSYIIYKDVIPIVLIVFFVVNIALFAHKVQGIKRYIVSSIIYISLSYVALKSNAPAILIALLFTSIIFLMINYNILKRELFIDCLALFAVAGALPVIIFFGADSGLCKLLYGSSLLVASGLLFVSSSHPAKDFKKFNIIFIVIFTVIGAYKFYSSPPYRDEKVSKLKYSFETPRLKHVYTSLRKQKSFNDLIFNINKHRTSNEQIFAYLEIPLLYFSLNTLPYEHHNWYRLMREDLLRQHAEKICKVYKPNLVVRNLINPYSPEWPPLTAETSKFFKKKREIVDKIIHTCNYTKVWSNGDFEILLRSK